MVERLAQQGLLPVICGTDTLGVGINVPIHTVVLTALTKFDGYKMRRLRAREFHQIAGRAGRAGFDTEGMVIAEAPEYEIENAKLIAKAGDDPKKLRKLKKKKPPEGFVTWNKQTFERLCEAVPETLKPRLRITNSMVLSMVERGGDARARVSELIEASLQTPEEKLKLEARASEIFATLIDTGVVVCDEVPSGVDAPSDTDASSGAGTSSDVDAPDGADAPGGTSAPMDAAPRVEYSLTVDLPEDFALDQPLSPFLLAALELLDPESDTYTFDLISMVEATLEDPKQVLRAQERQARDAAMAAMKADGVEYEERLERLQVITYPKPLEALLDAAFAQYCTKVPWAADYELSPKSVLRDMLESAADFKGYIQKLGIARSEGILLRYLAEAFRSLDRTVPLEKRNDQLNDIISWLGFVVRSVDSSLVDEWAAAGEDSAFDAAPPSGADVVVADRRGMTLLVRNALFRRVSLAARERADELGELDEAWGMGELRWRRALEAFFEAHEELLVDGDARSTAFFTIDESDELRPAAEGGHVWHVHQIFHDSDGDHDFGIMTDVDLDATQEESEAVFKNYRVGFIEELLEQG